MFRFITEAFYQATKYVATIDEMSLVIKLTCKILAGHKLYLYNALFLNVQCIIKQTFQWPRKTHAHTSAIFM